MRYIIGCDEVGLGAWAGPFYACAVAVPEPWTLPGLNDSKELAFEERARLYNYLHKIPLRLARANVELIDSVGIRKVLVEAHSMVIEDLLREYPDAEVIVDGIVPLPRLPRARLVKKADSIYPAVMAASVIAKHSRDAEMRELHKQHPYYGWFTNMGYGTKEHREGLATSGMTWEHRRSYEPMKSMRG